MAISSVVGFDVEALILDAVKKEADRVLKVEIEAMNSRIAAAMRESVGKIALSVMKHYEIERDGRSLIIRVRNEL